MSAQKISFWVAVLMSINIIVGGGIFSGPQSMAATAGGISFTAWLLMAILMFPVVWGIAQASRLFPGAGGFYNYCATGINKDFGFIGQWVYLLGYSLGTCAAMTTLLRNGFVERMGCEYFSAHPFIANALILAFFSLLNLMSVAVISKIQGGATLLKLLPLFFVILACPFYFNLSALNFSLSEVANLGGTIPFVIFGFLGFEACCSLGHMLEDGPKSVGKVILTAFTITSILYMFFNFGLLQIMGVENLANHGVMTFPMAMGLSSCVARVVSIVIIGSILLSYANSVFGVALGNVTNIVTLVQKKLIGGGDVLMQTNSIGRPTWATLIHGAIVWVFLCFITDVSTLFSFTVMGVSSAYFLTLVAVLLASLKRKDYVQAAVMVLGFMSCGILYYYCWVGLGADDIDRLIKISPLLVGTVLGYALYKIKQS